MNSRRYAPHSVQRTARQLRRSVSCSGAATCASQVPHAPGHWRRGDNQALMRSAHSSARGDVIWRQCAQCEQQAVQRQSLSVSQPHEPMEQEADTMADALMSGQRAPAMQSGEAAPGLQRQARRREGGGGSADGTALASVASSGGHSLDEATRQLYERFFGADLSSVRIHDNSAANRAANELDAHAFTRGPDLYFATGQFNPKSRDGQRLLTHELTHVLQPAASTGHGQDGVARDADPPKEKIKKLRQLLDDDKEKDALFQMTQLSGAEVNQVLLDDSMKKLAVSAFNDSEMVAAIRNMGGSAVPSLNWLFAEGVDYDDFENWLKDGPKGVSEVLKNTAMRDGFVDACDDAQMARALKLLSGDFATKVDWLRAEDVGVDEIFDVVENTPKAERKSIYADLSLRDWFVGVLDDIKMQNLVLALGGSLVNKLSWMKAEGSSWALIKAVLLGSDVTPADKSNVLDDDDLRQFFVSELNDEEMKQALDILGGTLSQKMHWLQAEGSTAVPDVAQTLPSVEPRDAALMQALDNKSELFKRFQETEGARKQMSIARAGSGAAKDKSAAADALEMAEERVKKAEAALIQELKKQGYASEEKFVLEVQGFQAFFTGFALQTAFLMLRENGELARKEKTRLGGPDMASLFDDLAPVRKRMPEFKAAEKKYVDSLEDPIDNTPRESKASPAARVERERIRGELQGMVKGMAGKYPVLASEGAQNAALLHIDNKEFLQKALIGKTDDVLEKVDKAREGLAKDAEKIWQLEPVIARAKQALGIVEGSTLGAMVQRKADQVQGDKLFLELALGALALGLGLVSGGTGTVAVLAGAGALGLSGWGAYNHWQEFVFEQGAHGSALDPGAALSQVEPSAVWLAVDIASVFIDAHGLVKAFQGGLGPAARALASAESAVKAQAQVVELEKVAKSVAGTLGKDAIKSEAALVAAVRRAAQRQVAQMATLEEFPELVAKIRKAAPALEHDPAAIAGLVRMGESGVDAALAAFAGQPTILRRLGTLAEAEPAVAAGLLRLRKSVPDNAAFEALLRDGLVRRDARRSQALLSAIGEGRMTEEQLGKLARAASEADPAKRAAAVTEAIEAEAKTALEVPLPGSQAEADALKKTSGLQGTIENPQVALADEWRVVQNSDPLPLKGDPDYVAEVALPNGHKWKKGKGGNWCRFSSEFCPTPAVIEELASRARAAEGAKRALQNPEAAQTVSDVAHSTSHQTVLTLATSKVAAAQAKLAAQFPVLGKLSQGAIERVVRAAHALADGDGLRLSKNWRSAARGQLLEEIGAVRVRAMLGNKTGKEALGLGHVSEELIFIEGHRITDATGAKLTDGIIAIQRGDKLEIVSVLESKAGQFAAEGLAEGIGGLSRASTAELMDALIVAGKANPSGGALARIAKMDPALHKVILETRGANLAALDATYRNARPQLMKALESLGPEGLKDVRGLMGTTEGQVSKDIERLMSGARRDVPLMIDGKPVMGNVPKRPSFLGAVPKDAATDDIAKQLTSEGFDFKRLDMGDVNLEKKELQQATDAVVNALGSDLQKAAK